MLPQVMLLCEKLGIPLTEGAKSLFNHSFKRFDDAQLPRDQEAKNIQALRAMRIVV
jgi:hypothetical protein